MVILIHIPTCICEFHSPAIPASMYCSWLKTLLVAWDKASPYSGSWPETYSNPPASATAPSPKQLNNKQRSERLGLFLLLLMKCLPRLAEMLAFCTFSECDLHFSLAAVLSDWNSDHYLSSCQHSGVSFFFGFMLPSGPEGTLEATPLLSTLEASLIPFTLRWGASGVFLRVVQ